MPDNNRPLIPKGSDLWPGFQTAQGSQTVGQDGYRFAEWRPKLPPEPNFRKRIEKIPWIAFALIAGVILVYAAIWYFSQSQHIFHYLIWLNVSLGIYLFTRFLRTPAAVTELMDIPFSLAQFPVCVTVSNYEATGKDAGVITFANDILHFEGRKISFDIPNSIVQPDFSPLRNGMTQRNGPYTFTWAAGAVRGEVAIIPYKSVKGSSLDFATAFSTAVDVWRMTDPTSHSTLILPPKACTVIRSRP